MPAVLGGMRALLLFSLLSISSAQAGVLVSGLPEGDQPTTSLDLPLYDAPFNYERGGYTFPSMRQSVVLSTDFYENVHRWIQGPEPTPSSWRIWAILGVDVFATWIPLGNSWMHEEWHRAVLSRNEISSYNETYTFPLFHSLISVNNVSDTDLVRLKKDHPADQVRLSSAGLESEVAQNLLVERHHFFDDAPTYDQALLILNALNPITYLGLCASKGADDETRKAQIAEGIDIGKRDFTGLDCTGWVYDLFRPDEPYTARGTHPSGVGINRYITNSQLTDRERNYLRLQFGLSFLNLLDPFLIGINQFDGHLFGEEVRWNTNVAHTLTSFGFTVDNRVFLRFPEEKFLFTLHNSFAQHYYPGATIEWLEHPVGEGFFLSPSFTLWSQPLDQRLDATHSRMLLSLSNEFGFRWTPATSMYFGVGAKTPGWLLGDPYIEGNFSVWAGYRTALF